MVRLSRARRAWLYMAVSERFGLNHRQRTRLDFSPQYSLVIEAAHAERWDEVRRLLVEASGLLPN